MPRHTNYQARVETHTQTTGKPETLCHGLTPNYPLFAPDAPDKAVGGMHKLVFPLPAGYSRGSVLYPRVDNLQYLEFLPVAVRFVQFEHMLVIVY